MSKKEQIVVDATLNHTKEIAKILYGDDLGSGVMQMGDDNGRLLLYTEHRHAAIILRDFAASEEFIARVALLKKVARIAEEVGG